MDTTNAPLTGLDTIRPWLESLYEHFHAHPELSMQEERTAARVLDELRAWAGDADVEYVTGLGGHGLTATVRNGEGPTVLLRADMDALPVLEESGLPYASRATGVDPDGRTVPVMHACGHDVHVTSLLGAFRLLCARRDAWSGTITFLFQPAEEAFNGAEAMVADGLVGRIPAPDVAFGQHVMPGPTGSVLMLMGTAFAGADEVRITLQGRGGHGSMPDATIDPVVMAASLVLRLQTIISREVDPRETAVVSVGAIRSGTKSNIIPSEAVIDLTVRTYNRDVRNQVLESIRRKAEAEASAAGAPPPEVVVYDSLPVTTNDREATLRVKAAFEQELPAGVIMAEPFSGSEDFSVLPDAFGAPYVYWGVGGYDAAAWADAEARGTAHLEFATPHSPTFVPVPQPTLDTGVSALVTATLAWLGRAAVA